MKFIDTKWLCKGGGWNVLWRLLEHDVKLSTKFVLKGTATAIELGKECIQLYLPLATLPVDG